MIQKLKRNIKSVWYYLSCKNYRIVKNSRLFDPEYYQDRVPGLQNTGKSPLIHYIDFGNMEGKSPSPFFDPVFYEKTYSIGSTRDSFVHYLTTGISAKHHPCRWFDAGFYQQQYLNNESDTTCPLLHYKKSGQQQIVYPNADILGLACKPLLSIVVPVYNVSPLHLNNCIRSVLYQSYPHWELCLVDDCSTDSNVRALLEKWASKDKRIKVDFLPKNSGISAATNKAVTLSTGEYLGFLDNDDELAVECLYTLVQQMNTEDADLYYTDEDLIGEDGTQFSVFCKPDFNPELLLCHNYITHFVLVRKSLFEHVGGLSSDKDGAQDFDLLLKLSEQADKIVHIPEVLYHWRASESSTSINHEQKSYADEAGKASVEEALQRRKIKGRVDATEWKYFYSVRKQLSAVSPISVLIFHRQDTDFSGWLFQLVKTSSNSSVEFCIIVDSNSSEVSELEGVRTLYVSPELSPAARYNEAVKNCTGEYIVFLDARIQIRNDDWLEGLLDPFSEKETAVVGAMLVRDKAEQEITTVPDIQNISSHYYSRFVQDCSRHMNGLQCAQNVCALSWDLMATKRSTFLEIGGFDASLFPSLFADIDYCLRIREVGFSLVYSPLVKGEWVVPDNDPASLSKEITIDEKKQFQKKWKHFLLAGDPFYNPGILKQAGITISEFKKWYAGEC